MKPNPEGGRGGSAPTGGLHPIRHVCQCTHGNKGNYGNGVKNGTMVYQDIPYPWIGNSSVYQIQQSKCLLFTWRWRKIHLLKHCDFVRNFKNFQRTMDKVQNKRSSNIIPSPKTLKEDSWIGFFLKTLCFTLITLHCHLQTCHGKAVEHFLHNKNFLIKLNDKPTSIPFDAVNGISSNRACDS
jgi:hypothetical protein